MGLFILVPVRTIINRCLDASKALSNANKYDEMFLTFASDYDRENPVSKQQGFLRLIDFKINAAKTEDNEEKRKKYEAQRLAIQDSTIFDAVRNYSD